MKKHFLTKITGFTLAEVLITLTVIGVIAALTIPALLQNINDAQYHTAWKSAYSDLSQATNRLKMDNAGSLNGVFQNAADIVYKFAPYFSYAKICPSPNGCWHLANNWYYLNGALVNWGDKDGFILGNGNLVMFLFYAQDCSDTSVSGNNMPACGFIAEDVNGFKGPNTLGKDIYQAWITKDGLIPTGTNDTHPNTCSTTGWSCSSQYLRQ